MPSSQRPKMRLWMQETEICEIVNVEPKLQCKVCLKHCSTGIIYCTCGHLMTNDSAENRKYISAILDTFSIPNFYIRKHRPHGHRYGKAPGCKDYFTANQLAKKCLKKKYDRIHHRYIRDNTFRKSMIDIEESYPTPHIHEQMTTSNYGYDTAYNFTHNNIMLEPNAMNNIDIVAHMNVHNTQY